ncbi:hypothetical protein ACJMK2_010311 [Sinanodonta woodiana]|uniref:MD-2-related lipid-recognition domain-containing protein n=1 Tax=Sinanodonta woodiana TaxID=1069815 RepID=A0ABD3VEX5_SINWO
MNLIILFLISQTITASFSIYNSFLDFLGEPSLESDTVSLGSPEQERGYVKNCYANSTYNISWLPKDIDPHGSLLIFANYTNPARINKGEYKLDAKYGFIHISTKDTLKCEDDIPDIFPFHSCPIEKGKFMVVGAFTSKKMIRLKNFTGTFKLKISVENENGESLFCGTIETTVL